MSDALDSRKRLAALIMAARVAIRECVKQGCVQSGLAR